MNVQAVLAGSSLAPLLSLDALQCRVARGEGVESATAMVRRT
jgi:hypothetical protein